MTENWGEKNGVNWFLQIDAVQCSKQEFNVASLKNKQPMSFCKFTACTLCLCMRSTNKISPTIATSCKWLKQKGSK